jgi:hypothetical protein
MTTNLSKFWRGNKMNCPYQEFMYDGNYGYELTGGECEGFAGRSCDIAAEFEEDAYEDD